jgi:uncharacterized protein
VSAGSANFDQCRTRFLSRIDDIDAARWNALTTGAAPFLRHEFLQTLEETRCVGPAVGWTPRHIVIESEAGKLLAAMPMYRKSHSRGEFVFDFAWANAYAQYGVAYYPKLLTAIPFTPVGGSRLLVADCLSRTQAVTQIASIVQQEMQAGPFSSWHGLFLEEDDMRLFSAAGAIERNDCQFHWHNRDYADFDAFLAEFKSDKRKKAKRERRRVVEAGIDFETRLGGEMNRSIWCAVYELYRDTFLRHGHEPYLGLAFFERLAERMPEAIMLKLARLHGSLVGAAFFFRGPNSLYGRYWGASGQFHSLHFETCYYQGIDYCIQEKLARFEPGTQGEHKVPRGFQPTITRSAHFIADPRFARAIRDYARRESAEVRAYAAAVDEHVPFRDATRLALDMPAI